MKKYYFLIIIVLVFVLVFILANKQPQEEFTYFKPVIPMEIKDVTQSDYAINKFINDKFENLLEGE